MTLLIALIAAVVSTIVWYVNPFARKLKIGILTLMYWGASIMWFVDAIAEYIELRAEFFTPSTRDMLNDSYLGISVVVLGMVIWLVILLVNDPCSVLRKK